MSEPIKFPPRSRENEGPNPEPAVPAQRARTGVPSNEVYARVGDAVLQAAQDGVRRGSTPDDIIREILSGHGVRLNVGELRLLLASRRI